MSGKKQIVQPKPTLHGIDGCPSGWLVLTLTSGAEKEVLSARIHGSIECFAATIGETDIVAIDMPIGLPERNHLKRTCDTEARRILGRRHVCVFPPPCRKALNDPDREKASDTNYTEIGQRINVFAWGIAPKIKELDDWLLKHPEHSTIFHEVHPEVSFAHWRQLADKSLPSPTPFNHSKNSPAGMEGRRKLIETETEWPGWISQAESDLGSSKPKSGTWDVDDLHDAFACLWTACRLAEGTAQRFPSGDPPPMDAKGLRMVIHA